MAGILATLRKSSDLSLTRALVRPVAYITTQPTHNHITVVTTHMTLARYRFHSCFLQPLESFSRHYTTVFSPTCGFGRYQGWFALYSPSDDVQTGRQWCTTTVFAIVTSSAPWLSKWLNYKNGGQKTWSQSSKGLSLVAKVRLGIAEYLGVYNPAKAIKPIKPTK